MAAWGEGAERAAEAVLRASGMTVRLRVPAPAAAGDEDEQLGLATPGFEDLGLGPAAFRKANSTRVLLLAASAVRQALLVDEADDAATVEASLAGAAGVVIGGVLYGIAGWGAMRSGERVYAYALTLVAPER